MLCPSQNDAKDTCTLTIDDQQIRPTRSLKILGIKMDDELSFSDHVSDMQEGQPKSGGVSKTS